MSDLITEIGHCSRRQAVQVGGLGTLGLSLPGLLAAAGSTEPTAAPAKSCILFYMEGGPSHIDLWDMKPDAPAEIRGKFKPIATRLPGITVCEHLDQWAPRMHQLAMIRSVTHDVNDHNAGTYLALTGKSPLRGSRLIVGPSPENDPPLGSVLAHLRPSQQLVPDFVHLPEVMFNNGHFLPGQQAGFLGDTCDPFVAGNPGVRNYRPPGLGHIESLNTTRLDRRRRLLAHVDKSGQLSTGTGSTRRLESFYEKAFSLVASPAAKQAFDLAQEPEALRRRYGLGFKPRKSVRKGGGLPCLGQSLLLARRLIEAGVRLVTVCSGLRYDQSWDTHRDHYPLLEKSLLPYANRAFAALLDDLTQRGLLEETLVVAMGEFGRTPKLGQITSGAGAEPDGRDHWPHCYSVFLAGAGVQAGTVYGASDRHAAYPAEKPVGPADIAATIYALMGVDPRTRIRDSLDRPHSVSEGTPIAGVMQSAGRFPL